MADEAGQKTERDPTQYVVVRDNGDGLTFVRIGGDAETTFEAFRKQDALELAIAYMDEADDEPNYDGDWLVAVPASSWKPLRATVETIRKTKIVGDDEPEQTEPEAAGQQGLGAE